MMQERRGYEPPQPLLVQWRQFGDLILIVSYSHNLEQVCFKNLCLVTRRDKLSR